MRRLLFVLSLVVSSAALAATNETASAVTNAVAAHPTPVRKFIDTKIYKLNHASALEVAEKFNSMWSGEFGQTWKVAKMAIAF